MQIYLRKFAIPLFISLAGAICTPAIAALAQQPTQSQTVRVFLTDLAEVTLKNKRRKQGRITNLDARKQQLILTRGGQSEAINVNQIQNVVSLRWDGGKWTPLSPPKGGEVSWLLPLSNTRIRSANNKLVEVDLPQNSNFNPKRNNVYVIKELSFPAANRVSVRVFIYE